MNRISPLVICIWMLLAIACKENTSQEESTAHTEHAEPEHADTLFITQAQYQNAKIALGKIQQDSISDILNVNGLLEVPPQNIVTIASLMAGRVNQVLLKPGMQVRKGQLLAVIQNPELVQWQQEYLDNKGKLAFAQQEYARQKELAKDNTSSRKTYQQSLSDYQSLNAIKAGLVERLQMLGIDTASLIKGNIKSQLRITSPVNGFVTEVNVNTGKYVTPQEPIAEIVDSGKMYAVLRVFDKDLNLIKIGQEIRLQLNGTKDEYVNAVVELINRKIETDRTIKVYAAIKSADVALIPNTYIKGSISINSKLTMVLPSQAFVEQAGKTYIFIRLDKAKTHNGYAFARIEVNKGITENGYSEVVLPTSFHMPQADIVVQGGQALLASMTDMEAEGHAH